MATTWPVQTNTMTKTTAQNAANTFVPQMWSDELLVSRESNLVAAKLFKRINHKGREGDTITLPFVSHFSANNKTAGSAVTIQANAEGKIAISLDKHKEVSFLEDDLLKVQSQYDLRAQYTREAGYALAKAIDTDILALFDAGLGAGYKLSGSDGDTVFAAGNEGDLTDKAIRNAIELLDNNDVPMDNRFMIIPPSQKNALLGIDKFVLYQNIGRTNEIQKGTFGEIYGLKVYITTNLPTISSVAKPAILAHRDSVCCAIQRDVRIQSQYKQEYLANLVTADVIYGVKALRVAADDVSASNNRASHAVALYVPV
jgi:N4-gp56 family major capsid protein